MAKIYMVTLKEDIEETLCQAREMAAANGWSLEGDTGRGEFSGSGVKGRYVARGNKLTITVTDKPFLASWNNIGKGIKKIFS